MSIAGGIILYGNSPKEYKIHPNQIYQGYTGDEGRGVLVFDSEGPDREGNPDLAIFGNPRRLGLDSDELLGEPFDLLVKIPRIGTMEVVKATPTEE